MKPSVEDKPINVRDAQIAIHMGEYSALRAELISFQGLEYQAIQFAIAVATAIVGFIIQAKTASPARILEVRWLLAAAAPFGLLGCLFAYAQLKVMLVAHYLDRNLRPKLTALVLTEVLEWEVNRRDQLWKTRVKALSEAFSLLRWALFVWPLVVLERPFPWEAQPGPLLLSVLWAERVAFGLLGFIAIYCWYYAPRWVVGGGIKKHGN